RSIETEITYSDSLLRLRFRDDGKGIDAHVLERGGRSRYWGLPGMRERAKQIGAELEVWSELGAGTEVELSIPGSSAYVTPGRRRKYKPHAYFCESAWTTKLGIAWCVLLVGCCSAFALDPSLDVSQYAH